MHFRVELGHFIARKVGSPLRLLITGWQYLCFACLTFFEAVYGVLGAALLQQKFSIPTRRRCRSLCTAFWHSSFHQGSPCPELQILGVLSTRL